METILAVNIRNELLNFYRKVNTYQWDKHKDPEKMFKACNYVMDEFQKILQQIVMFHEMNEITDRDYEILGVNYMTSITKNAMIYYLDSFN